jgi:hypothetical protein
MARELLCTLGEDDLGAEFLERDKDGSRPSGDGAQGFNAPKGDFEACGGGEPLGGESKISIVTLSPGTGALDRGRTGISSSLTRSMASRD